MDCRERCQRGVVTVGVTVGECAGAQAEALATGPLERDRFSAMKKYSAGCIILLHAGTNLVFCKRELTSPSARVRTA
jgi:hypothetical protein